MSETSGILERPTLPSQKQTALKIYDRLASNACRGPQMDILLFLNDLTALDWTGEIRKQEVLRSQLLKAGADPLLKEAVLGKLRESKDAGNKRGLREHKRQAEILGIDTSPVIPKPQNLKTKGLMAIGATMIGAGSLMGVIQPPSWDTSANNQPQQAQSAENPKAMANPQVSPSVQPAVQKAPAQTATSPAKSPEPTKAPPATKSPEPTAAPKTEVKKFKKDIFREQIAPLIYNKILKNREERAKQDPEFVKRTDTELNKGRINILVSGGRQGDALTDSIQLLSYDFGNNSMHVISLPRDLQSPEVLKATGDARNSRINQALSKGGPELFKTAVENATGLSVDLYVHTNFDVLRDFISQTTGTIDVELDAAVRDDHYPTENYGIKSIYYPKGKNTVTGEQALELARSRYGSSDYDRSQRQQKIMTAFVDKLLSAGLLDQLKYLKTLNDLWNQKVGNKTLQPDFDLNGLFFSDLWGLISSTPQMLLDRIGGVRIAERPAIFSTGLTGRNLVVGADIPGIAITKIKGGNASSANPREGYYKSSRDFTEKFIKENKGEPPDSEEIIMEVPAKEGRILYPKELSYDEVKPWLGKLRNAYPSVLTESIFTSELAAMPADLRQKVMEGIAKAHAAALIEHYRDQEAIIGLDPGHGGTDIGSAAVTAQGEALREQSLAWQLTQMTAEEIYRQTEGKYIVVILRPEVPRDEDLDGDGIVSAVERLQKRKALLAKEEERLRPDPNKRGKNIVYLSVHLNGVGDPSAKGAETFWPNGFGVSDPSIRTESEKLARGLHSKIVGAIKEAGYNIHDRGAKEDPDKNQPGANSDPQRGPYVVLGSPKLDRHLKQ